MKSANNNFEFEQFTQVSLRPYITPRKGETKLGERVMVGDLKDETFIILGICEDIGPRANYGNSGSKHAFDAFLAKFLNMQSNKTLIGSECFLAGRINAKSDSDTIDGLRTMVSELDNFVQEVLNLFDVSNKTVIIIGGGHNNAYPIIKHYATKNSPLHILNVDPHADCRPLEGRHSGNPFSTAIVENLLLSYTVFGLHQRYNSEGILAFLEAHHCEYRFFEDYLDGQYDLLNDLGMFIEQCKGKAMGIEIDLDCIQSMPTSAIGPSGFSVNEIRSFVRALPKNIAYLHLPEGAPTTPHEAMIVGKTLAYLVSDLITCQQKT